MSTAATEPEVRIRIDGRAGRITLNRPKALNALTLPMVREIWAALLAWKDDPHVAFVILDGAGERGLCAGGDVRSLYDSRGEGSGFARTFWREEYHLNALIHRYPKPFVAVMDGIVMGGGIGLSAHAQGGTRLVTERSQLAMPETSIGLIPDVGGTFVLARSPGELGIYLGLVGARMAAGDAILAGFADRFVEAARLPALLAQLSDPDGGPLEAALAAVTTAPPPPALDAVRGLVDATFGADSVASVRDALAASADPAAAGIAAELDKRSPLALEATLAAIGLARARIGTGLGTLEAALAVEFRLCTRLYEHGEFIEGVRALIIDKDRQPRWRPAGLADVSVAMVAGLMAPLPPADELAFPAS